MTEKIAYGLQVYGQTLAYFEVIPFFSYSGCSKVTIIKTEFVEEREWE